MAAKNIEYRGFPALLLRDKSLNISLIVTAMRAQLIMENIEAISEFLEQNQENIEVEAEVRRGANGI